MGIELESVLPAPLHSEGPLCRLVAAGCLIMELEVVQRQAGPQIKPQTKRAWESPSDVQYKLESKYNFRI